MLITPGNHDVSLNNVWIKHVNEKYGENYKAINDTIEGELSAIYKEYNDFVNKYNLPPNGIGIKYIMVNGITIRVILINSSWGTLAHNVYGELVVGDKQLGQIKNTICEKKRKYDVTITCMHHPLDWFSYEERKKLHDFLFDTIKTDFLLHGHIHEASYDSLFNMDSSTNIFCTGISYNKTGEKCSRKDGMRYSIYEIDIDTCTINVYLRSTNSKNVFVGDNRLYSKVNKEGFFTIPMGNISECLLPVKKANKNESKSIFINRDFVELLLNKEEMLFRFYCGMEIVLEEQILSKKDEYIQQWKEKHNIKRFTKEEKEKCLKEFYIEHFEIYCLYALMNLNALFFKDHKDVRFLLRRYDSISNKHVAMLADGIFSTTEDLNNVKNFTWGEGMIHYSYKCKCPLLMSQNMECHKDGNSKGVWKEYLTIAIDGIKVQKSRELIPLFALNIATNSTENERCLQALAMSSIYYKLQEVFGLYDSKVCELATLYI